MFGQLIRTSMRPRRSLFNVPGSDLRKIAKIPHLKADCIVLDLEDGVPLDKKQEARNLVLQSLDTSSFPLGSERAVRINSVDSGLAEDDLNAIDKLEAVVIPKVNKAKDVDFVASIVEKTLRKSLKLIPCIESAESILNLTQICIAHSSIEALVFASEDYCADTGTKRTSNLLSLLYARSAVVTAAKAFNKQAIDIVCIEYKNTDRLQFECLDGKDLGFTGKQAIHPLQIECIQRLFSPTAEEVENAQRVINGYRDCLKQGKGAFEMDGKMVDMPIIRAALRVLSNAGISIN